MNQDADLLRARRLEIKILLGQRRFDEAAALCRELISADPDDAANFANLGAIYSATGRFAEASESLRQAISLGASAPHLHRMLARALKNTGEITAAIRDLVALRAYGPLPTDAECELFEWRQSVADWHEFEAQVAGLTAAAHLKDGLFDPYVGMGVPGIGGALQHAIAAGMSGRLPRGAKPDNRGQGRVRLGYISPDFQHSHPVGRHILEVIRRHDRGHFEVRGYGLEPRMGKNDAFHEAFDGMRYFDALDDAAAAQAIRNDGIEILIDLAGFTTGGRAGIAALRPAPVQVNFLGHCGTMGADFIDYTIADATAVPAATASHFTEAIAHMPETYFNGFWERPEIPAIGRAKFGTADDAFVFCAFCTTFKINPAIFAVWMRLLAAIPNGVLWLRAHQTEMSDNLRRQAEAAGIDPARLICLPRVATERHLAQMACADLFLDTFPYTAGSTAADALWAGLPVLTCAGETFISRMAASMVRAAGLPQLIARDLREYEAKALDFARNPALQANARERLAQARRGSPLFDIVAYTARLERLYLEMSRRSRRGEPVTPIP